MRRQNEIFPKELKALGQEVRRRRVELGFSQVVFSKMMAISNKQLNNIELGRNWPSFPVYLKFCYEFKAPVAMVAKETAP